MVKNVGKFKKSGIVVKMSGKFNIIPLTSSNKFQVMVWLSSEY